MDGFEHKGVSTNDPTSPDGAVHVFRSTAINHLIDCCAAAVMVDEPDVTEEVALRTARRNLAAAILEHLEHPSHVSHTWYNRDIAAYIIHDIDKALSINRDRWKTFIETGILGGNTLVLIISVTGPIK